MASTGCRGTWRRISLIAVCSAGVAACTAGIAPFSVSASSGPDQVAGTVAFRVTNPQSTRVQGAAILVVDNAGHPVATGTTDKSGSWTASLRAPVDARFRADTRMGTVTAIVAASGYNEALVLDVPVHAATAQPVTLLPMSSKGRNEPQVVLGNIHRQTVITTIDHYARLAHWTRQTPAVGEGNYAPYAPTEKRS
ncbi:MAG: carboxypeptidase-like regulatory domain-containing protein [Firmicutes bacterium]|nr:carboxypeptidase-like regulatory domain-containing protein [Bacillota bacterium]